MTEIVIATVRREGLTVDRVVIGVLGRHVPGVVEAVFDRNRGLAETIHLPLGTRVEIPMPDAAAIADAAPVIFLTD